MLINTTANYPEKLRRGFISPEDRRMVSRPTDALYYKLRFSNAKFKMCFEANYYHQSNIFSRLIARVIATGGGSMEAASSGRYTELHEMLLAGDVTAWDELKETCPDLRLYKKLVPKVVRYIQGADDCFNMLQMVKGYWTHALKLPAPFLSAYIEGIEDPTDGSVYSINRLLTTPTFKAMELQDQATWIAHLEEYTKDVKQVEKLEAVRGYAIILGDEYKFLLNSCNELLL
ncbi:MAG: hypothetical protein MJK15_00785 [Colwellia sp.]|nr:hypothetical protein [Colwellia sp.]